MPMREAGPHEDTIRKTPITSWFPLEGGSGHILTSREKAEEHTHELR